MEGAESELCSSSKILSVHDDSWLQDLQLNTADAAAHAGPNVTDSAAHQSDAALWQSYGSRDSSAAASQPFSQPATPLQQRIGTNSTSDAGAASPAARLPPLKHMLRASVERSPLLAPKLDMKPLQKAQRPASVRQLDMRSSLDATGIAYSNETALAALRDGPEQDVLTSAQQQQQRRRTAHLRPASAEPSPSQLNVKELLAAAEAARQLEEEVSALRRQLQDEAAGRQQAEQQLKDVHAENERCSIMCELVGHSTWTPN